jgi:hypothetical protein
MRSKQGGDAMLLFFCYAAAQAEGDKTKQG